MTTNAHQLLEAAANHMRGRASTYDKPEGERSMAQTVAVFNQFHGTALTEAHGWHFLQVLKDVRLFTRPGYHADSAEDAIAYSALKAEAKAKEASQPTVEACCGRYDSCNKPCVPRLQAQADADGWIAWGGSDCPVPDGVRVCIRTRDGDADVGRGNLFGWQNTDSGGDIIAFKIIT